MHRATAPFGGDQLRSFFGGVPSAVVALAAMTGSGAAVMVVCSFTSVSLAPPLLVVAVRNESSTWPRLRSSPRMGGSILSRDQAGLARQLSSGDCSTRLSAAPVLTAESGALHIDGAAGWFEARVVDEHPAGDHCLAVLELDVIAAARSECTPLVFHRSEFSTVADVAS